jgi:hypothetical protein
MVYIRIANQTLTLITLLPQIAVAQSESAGVHSLFLEHLHENVIAREDWPSLSFHSDRVSRRELSATLLTVAEE